MKHSTFEELFAQAIGTEVLKYLSHEDAWKTLVQGLESTALPVLTKIQAILNDEALDDPACFRRIDAIVEAFHQSGLSTTRHDF